MIVRVEINRYCEICLGRPLKVPSKRGLCYQVASVTRWSLLPGGLLVQGNLTGNSIPSVLVAVVFWDRWSPLSGWPSCHVLPVLPTIPRYV